MLSTLKLIWRHSQSESIQLTLLWQLVSAGRGSTQRHNLSRHGFLKPQKCLAARENGKTAPTVASQHCGFADLPGNRAKGVHHHWPPRGSPTPAAHRKLPKLACQGVSLQWNFHSSGRSPPATFRNMKTRSGWLAHVWSRSCPSAAGPQQRPPGLDKKKITVRVRCSSLSLTVELGPEYPCQAEEPVQF